MSLSRFLWAGALAAALAATAHAATVVTPPVIPDVDGTFFCIATNVSLRTLTLRIDGGRIRASVEVLSSSEAIEAVYPVP